MIPSLVGPILSIILFQYYGDNWDLDQMRPVFLAGLVFDFPAALTLFMLSDELAVKEEEEESDQEEDDNESSTATATASTDSDSLKEKLLSSSPKASKKKRVYTLRIPLTMFIGETILAIGAGMTVKYGALFFKKDIELSPVGVQGVYIANMITISILTITATKMGKILGRVQAAFIARIIGIQST
jgi:hypothetical protein